MRQTAAPQDTTVAANVRAEVARRGLTGRKLAEALEWSPASTARRLKGDVPFTVNELTDVARVLGVPMTALLGETAAA